MVAVRSLIQARSRIVAAALVVALAVGASACGGDNKSSNATTTSRPPSTTSTSGPTTSSSAHDDTAVRAAYDAANRAFIDAAAIPDPDSPAIPATHTGAMLQQTRDLLRSLKADGRVIRYPPNSQYRVVIESARTDGDVSRIRFCAVDDGQRVDARTGQVISEGVVTARGEAALRLEGGVWKLAEQKFDSRTAGVSCG